MTDSVPAIFLKFSDPPPNPVIPLSVYVRQKFYNLQLKIIKERTTMQYVECHTVTVHKQIVNIEVFYFILFAFANILKCNYTK